jgi:hypothetical protein
MNAKRRQTIIDFKIPKKCTSPLLTEIIEEEKEPNPDVGNDFTKINEILNRQFLPGKGGAKSFVNRKPNSGTGQRDAHRSVGSEGSKSKDQGDAHVGFDKAFDSFKRTNRRIIDLRKHKYDVYNHEDQASTQATSKNQTEIPDILKKSSSINSNRLP